MVYSSLIVILFESDNPENVALEHAQIILCYFRCHSCIIFYALIT